MNARYGAAEGLGSDDESESMGVEALSGLSLNITPGRKVLSGAVRGKGYGGPSRRGGRHSVAADTSGTGPLTLRDQEQVGFHLNTFVIRELRCLAIERSEEGHFQSPTGKSLPQGTIG
jgi:hypothetical protein